MTNTVTRRWRTVESYRHVVLVGKQHPCNACDRESRAIVTAALLPEADRCAPQYNAGQAERNAAVPQPPLHTCCRLPTGLPDANICR